MNSTYNAEDIRRLLTEGKTVQEVADSTDWPRQLVLANINGWPGYLYNRATDKAVRPGKAPQPAVDEPKPAPAPVLVPTPAAVPPRRPAEESAAADPGEPELEPARALLALIGRTLREVSRYDDPAVSRDLERARTALERLEEALTVGQRRRAAEAAVAKAREDLAAAEARLKELKGGKAKPATGPTAKEIRAWCAANRVPVNPQGQIPQSVRDRYDAAHSTT